jgi:DNA-binding transcriptional ArsR family regulator
MDAAHFLSTAGSLIGDRSRAAMLWSLMGGEARPASELAMLANVSPQTASNHLRLLVDSGFLKVESAGRNKFYRLGGRPVADALESLATAAGGKTSGAGLAQHSAPDLMFARTCYDHLAGELGVALLQRLQNLGYLRSQARDYRLTNQGRDFLRTLGVDIDGAQAKRRRFAYACMDWCHRGPHLGGALGAALLDWLLGGRMIARLKHSRALRLTDLGQRRLHQSFEIRLARSGKLIAQS